MGKVSNKTSQHSQNGPKIFDYFQRKDKQNSGNQSINSSNGSLLNQSLTQTNDKTISGEKDSPKKKSSKRKNESEPELDVKKKKKPKKLILLSDSEDDMIEEVIDRSKSSKDKLKLNNKSFESKDENVVKEKKLKNESSVEKKGLKDTKQRRERSKQTHDSSNDSIEDKPVSENKKQKMKSSEKSVKKEAKSERKPESPQKQSINDRKSKTPQKQVKNELIIEAKQKSKTPQKEDKNELIIEKTERKPKTPQKSETLSDKLFEQKVKLNSKQSPKRSNSELKPTINANNSLRTNREPKSERKPLNESNMWVDKYKPLNAKQVIGQQGEKSCVNKLIKWLTNWHKNMDQKPGFGKFASDEGIGFKAALLSGPPGIGKTTSAQLVCQELGFDYCELNASDARNKKSLEEEVKQLLKNTTLTNYFNSCDTKRSSFVSNKHVVIMDEVDGMAGNEDRGGVQELILLIKTTKVPIICICNDRSHPKMRSLVNYCFDLRFFRPRIEQIKGAMMSIAYKEGIQISPNVLHELIVSSNQDIRQVLHNLSLLSTGTKRIDNLLSEKSIKDVKLGPFDAIRKVFTSGEEYARMSFQDKSDLFFCDYSIMPLFVFENYISVTPSGKKSEAEKLKLASKAIDAMAFGDLIEKEIRSSNNWSLLPLQAAFSSVMPGHYMNGHIGHQIQFPALMGKMSTTNKRNRLLQELKMHMNLKVSGSKTALNLDYLEPLRDSIIRPLITNGTGGVPKAIETLEYYCLRREDIESITELTLWDSQKDPMSSVEPKTKAALTRAYNKEGFCLPYSLGTVKKGRKGVTSDDFDGEEGFDDLNEDNEEDNDEDNIDLDAMIKAKKKTAKKSPKNKDENDSKRKTPAKKSKKSETETEPKSKGKRKQSQNSSKGKAKGKQ